MADNRDDYRGFAELLEIINEMRRPVGGITYAYIMERWGISKKTAERLVKVIEEYFGNHFDVIRDVENHRVKRFRLDSTSEMLPPEYLSTEDIQALNAVIKTSQNSKHTERLKELENKLSRVMQRRTTATEFDNMESTLVAQAASRGPVAKIDYDEGTERKIKDAILRQRVILMKYRGYEFTVRPLGLLYGKNNHYLVAVRTDDPETKRTYVLQRIEYVEPTRERFNPGDFNIHTFARQSFGVFHEEDGPFDVVWLVKKPAVRDAMRYTFHESQNITHNPDGTMTISMRASGLREMAWHLFTWGGAIIPLAPQRLVDDYRKLLTDVLASLK